MATPRLLLDPLRADDLTAFTALMRVRASDPSSRFGIRWPTDDRGIRDTLDWFCRSGDYLAIRLRDAAEPLAGFVYLHRNGDTAETGFYLRPDLRRHGLMREAMTAVLNELRSKGGVSLVTAETADANLPSRAFLVSAGFSRASDLPGIPVFENGKVTFQHVIRYTYSPISSISLCFSP